VEIVFLLTLPGLVILIIVTAVIRMIHARVTGKPRPSSGSVGIDMLDTLLRPGSEHRLEHNEQEKILREDQGNDEPEEKP
jgi:hypothetical protein